MHTKTFTVKDFITYNSPCFSCKNKISFRIGVSNGLTPYVYLTPTVNNDFIDIDLKINYNNALNIKIYPKTNKFTTSSIKGLTKYLEEHNLFLKSHCDECGTNIDSKMLEFNLLKMFIKPVGICDERLVVDHNHYKYEVYSSFEHNYSVLIVSEFMTKASSIRMELPLLPIYKLKNRERFIEKVKTYILFS